MEFIKQYLEKDIVNELINNYQVDWDESRWNEILQNETAKYLQTQSLSFQEKVKERSFIDRRLFTLNECHCQARIWNEGHGGQCSRKKKFGDFCGKHNTETSRWCGIITEERPIHPVNTKGKEHTWRS